MTIQTCALLCPYCVVQLTRCCCHHKLRSCCSKRSCGCKMVNSPHLKSALLSMLQKEDLVNSIIQQSCHLGHKGEHLPSLTVP